MSLIWNALVALCKFQETPSQTFKKLLLLNLSQKINPKCQLIMHPQKSSKSHPMRLQLPPRNLRFLLTAPLKNLKYPLMVLLRSLRFPVMEPQLPMNHRFPHMVPLKKLRFLPMAPPKSPKSPNTAAKYPNTASPRRPSQNTVPHKRSQNNRKLLKRPLPQEPQLSDSCLAALPPLPLPLLLSKNNQIMKMKRMNSLQLLASLSLTRLQVSLHRKKLRSSNKLKILPLAPSQTSLRLRVPVRRCQGFSQECHKNE